MRAMNGNMLCADQILAIRHVLWYSEFNIVLGPGAPSGPLEILGLVAHAGLVDLEPLTPAFVLACGAWGFGHVDEGRAWVFHCCANAEFHGEFGAGFDGQGAGAAGAREGAFVAAEVGEVGSQVVEGVLPLGGIVLYLSGIFANVLIGAGFLTVHDCGFKEVVGGGQLRDGCCGEDRELHGEKSEFGSRGRLVSKD